MGSFLLGAAMVAGGLSGNLAMAQSFNGNMPGVSDTNGCGPSGGQPKKCEAVPEPSSMILLGAGMAGLGFWAWKRKSTKG